MITDARVLQTEFVPGDIKHRDGEINYLSSTLRPILNDEPTDPSLLYGPSGTGKTCIARYTLEKLREEAIGLNTQYVNCWENHSRFKTLYHILDGIQSTVDIHRQSTPTDVLLDRVRNADKDPYVVVLDEVDQLQDKSLLYDLYRIPNLSMILIANQENELLSGLDERITSRLQAMSRIPFNKYDEDEVTSILADRVKWGLREDAITEPQLTEIARAANGDARIAIATLRAAAQRATQSQEAMITDEMVRNSVPEAKNEIQQKNEDKLTDNQRVIYEIISEHELITPGDLYEKYRERVDNPKTERTVRNYLQKMLQYNLIISEGENRGRQYRIA